MASQPLKRIVIHGSCITRDIFRNHPAGFDILRYYARSCISSVIAAPMVVNENDLPGLTSLFDRAIVANDLKKTLFRQVAALQVDYFLIDFIDERLNLLRNNASCITKSPELVTSQYPIIHQGDFTEVIRFDYPLPDWKVDCDRYVEILTRIVPQDKIIIVRGKWAEHFKEASGNLTKFSGDNDCSLDYIIKMNLMLDNYYDHLTAKLPKAGVVSYPPAIAHLDHLWGLAPYHYLPEQYAQVYQEICSLVN